MNHTQAPSQLTPAHGAAPPALPWSDELPPEADVVIVGGGFSGLMALVHLVRESPTARVVLIERRPTRTPGVAYGACDPIHLLNVPAGRMGATSADIGAFHAWLEQRQPGQFKPDSFAPRGLYGKYLLELVAERVASARNRISLLDDAVVHMDSIEDRLELLMSSGRTCAATCAVLAPGIPPARAPWTSVSGQVPRQLLIADPWDAGAFQNIGADDPIAIVGSGLTAIDVVLSLRSRGHRGHITMISRNGRLPLPHAAPGEPPHELTRAQLEGGPARALAALRAAAKQRTARGHGWQAALDAVRPHTSEVWRSWTTAQRQSFLRHARSQWEVHRHRVPHTVLQQLTPLMDAGALTIAQGSLARLSMADGARVAVEYEGPSRGSSTAIVARVYNCIGPTTSVRQTADPLLRSLISSGMAATDAAGLGILTSPSGHLIDANGAPDPRLYLVGALRRADSWESTAVPELRVQAERVAREVAAALSTFRSEGAR